MHVIINMLKHDIIIIITFIVCYSGSRWSGGYATIVTYMHSIVLFGGKNGGGCGDFVGTHYLYIIANIINVEEFILLSSLISNR